eukprot:scaffold482885_cov42-Prasinocladus_malaysianus.AAC.1
MIVCQQLKAQEIEVGCWLHAQRTLAAATEVYGGWSWGGGWASMASDGAADAERAQSYILMALAEVNRVPAIASLTSPGLADR